MCGTRGTCEQPPPDPHPSALRQQSARAASKKRQPVHLNVGPHDDADNQARDATSISVTNADVQAAEQRLLAA